MFSFFKNRNNKTRIIDRVFISAKAKQTAVAEFLRQHSNGIVIFWFEESYDQLQSMLSSNGLSAEFYLAKQVSSHHVQNKPTIFFEHYPLSKKESELIDKLQLKEAIFYSSLDEPFFRHFGGDKIISLVERLGLSENEMIQHTMINNAIRNAQEKLSEQVSFEQSAVSQADWFSKNLPK